MASSNTVPPETITIIQNQEDGTPGKGAGLSPGEGWSQSVSPGTMTSSPGKMVFRRSPVITLG